VQFDVSLKEHEQGLLFDPQTSGGLLMAISAERAVALRDALRAAGEPAAIVGSVEAGGGEIRIGEGGV
jgi:selenide,water dikinase